MSQCGASGHDRVVARLRSRHFESVRTADKKLIWDNGTAVAAAGPPLVTNGLKTRWCIVQDAHIQESTTSLKAYRPRNRTSRFRRTDLDPLDDQM